MAFNESIFPSNGTQHAHKHKFHVVFMYVCSNIKSNFELQRGSHSTRPFLDTSTRCDTCELQQSCDIHCYAHLDALSL